MRRLGRRRAPHGALAELGAGALIGSGFGAAAYSLDHGVFWVALLFAAWGAVLTLLVVLAR